MALTRKFLSAMGIEADKVDEIIEAHAQTVNGLKDKITELESSQSNDGEKLAGVQKELDDTKKELDALKKAQAKDAPYEQRYNDLKKEYEDYKNDIDAKATKAKVTDAYKAVLKEAKIADKYVNVILKATDLSKFKLAEDGTLEDAKEAVNKAAEEWAEFVETTSAKGKKTENPPQNTGGGMSKADILKIKDRNERQKAISENHELFGY